MVSRQAFLSSIHVFIERDHIEIDTLTPRVASRETSITDRRTSGLNIEIYRNYRLNETESIASARSIVNRTLVRVHSQTLDFRLTSTDISS